MADPEVASKNKLQRQRNISFAKITFDGVMPIAIDRSAIVIDTIKTR